MRYAKTAVLELPKDERAHLLDGATTIAEPRLSKSGNHRTTARCDLTGHSTYILRTKEAPALAPAHGLDNSEAGPKAVISRPCGPARPGLGPEAGPCTTLLGSRDH